MTEPILVNFDDAERRARVGTFVRNLRGKKWVHIYDDKPKRSTKQLAYYFGVVVDAFQRFLRGHEQYWEKEEIHSWFLQQFAPRQLIDPLSGDVLGTVGNRSSRMDTAQFAEFVEHCRKWMLDRFGIETEDPDPAYASKAKVA